MVQLDLVRYESHTGGGFEEINVSWRADEARHCERPGKTIGVGAASVAIEVPGLKGSCKEVEAWHHEGSL